METYSLSVICPVYNEAALIEPALGTMLTFLRRHFRDFEILLIESGSTDGSGAVCDGVGKANPEVRVIHEGVKRGFGSAVRTGYREAKKDLVWLITVDLPFALEHILEALPLLEQCDCVFSYRSKDSRGIGRRTLSFLYNTAVKQLVGLKARNANSAFKVMKREVVLPLPLTHNGWLIDVELIHHIEKRGIRYRELPVPLIDRAQGNSSITVKSALKTGVELLRFAKNLR